MSSSVRAFGLEPHSDAENAATPNIPEHSLKPNQRRALAALLTSTSIRAAASECGLTEQTLHRYLKDPLFKRAYDAERKRMLEEAVAVLQQGAVSAAEALLSGLEDSDADVRIRAARALWEFMLRGVETERRLDESEIIREWEQTKELLREHGIHRD